MYRSFYQLSAHPFHITADPAFLYLSPSHREALAAIAYGIEEKKGFIGVTGEIGVGKTTVLRSYLEGVGIPNVKPPEHIIYIFNANMSFPALLQTICRELDTVVEGKEVHEIVNHLYTVLIALYQEKQTVVLVIDEAQNMPVETLENLRMLSNLETSRDKLIQIVLVGQTELENLLERHELRQLRQRIAIRSRIQPLTYSESMEYLYHRLSLVTETPSSVFKPSALRLIARRSQGAPRVMNILADNALIAGFGYQKKPVSAPIVREVIADYAGRRRWRHIWRILGMGVAAMILVGLAIETRLIDFAAYLKNRPAAISATTGQAPPPGSSGKTIQKMEIPKPKAEATENAAAVVSSVAVAPLENVSKTAAGSIEPAEKAIAEAAKPEEHMAGKAPVTAPIESSAIPKQPLMWRITRGDTLFHIAISRYGTSDAKTIQWILSQNPQITNPDLLIIDEVLVLPDRMENRAVQP
jgi:general secretion pathway protein A